MITARAASIVTALALVSAGCAPKSEGSASGSEAPAGSVFARRAASSASDPAAPKVASSIDPGALAELLLDAPKPKAKVPTGVDGGTAIGTDTTLPLPSASASAGPAAPPAPQPSSSARAERPIMTSHAIERALRAEVYWHLVQRCRDPSGAILPREAVHLSFIVDEEGEIVPSTITSKVSDKRFVEASRCMQRELSMMTFHAPASARGRRHIIKADVPAAD